MKRQRRKWGFYEDIPHMIDRACRHQGITKKELGRRLGYSPESIRLLINGEMIDGMPVAKLANLMKIAGVTYKLEEL